MGVSWLLLALTFPRRYPDLPQSTSRPPAHQGPAFHSLGHSENPTPSETHLWLPFYPESPEEQVTGVLPQEKPGPLATRSLWH